MGEINLYRIFVGIPEGKRPQGRPRCKWEYNIIMDFRKMRREDVWVHPTQNRDQWRILVNMIMKLQVP
jgi:hypothetical protein